MPPSARPCPGNSVPRRPGAGGPIPIPRAGAYHPRSARTHTALEQHQADLTHAIVSFLAPLLPTEEEYRIKEALRRRLQKLAQQIDPHASLLAFGSMANGFALRCSDMDLCCLVSDAVAHPDQHPEGHSPPPAPPGCDAPPLSAARASELVEQFAQLIREQTDFQVMPLPQARIPIIKIHKPASETQPYELSCDIGFENRLALENTRLLLSYAMVDPPRVRTLVLFLKVWAKRRKLNSPFTGTLSSYGYTLMAIYYLMHIKHPPVLPNLQRMDLGSSTHTLQGHDVHFYDDIARVRAEWRSDNHENVASLLMGFFAFFGNQFAYAHDVLSIKSPLGTFPKDGVHFSGELCIQDPFAEDINISRPVTKDGLYTIRGEFFRATKILSNRSQSAQALIEDLCQERDETLHLAPDMPRRRWRPPSNGLSGGVSLGLPLSPRHRGSGASGASGVGGSFAFEAMARGLGKGQHVSPGPSQAMLQPLSHSRGLTDKPRGRRAGQTAPPQTLNSSHSPSERRGSESSTTTAGPRGRPLRSNSSHPAISPFDWQAPLVSSSSSSETETKGSTAASSRPEEGDEGEKTVG